MAQFIMLRLREQYFLKQWGQYLNGIDQQEIMDGAGIGNGDTHEEREDPKAA